MNPIKTILLIALLAGVFQSNNATAQFSGQNVNFKLNRYNSAPSGLKLPVEPGDILATIHFTGWTPANEFQPSTAIRSTVVGPVSAGILPARMDFHNGESNLFDMRRMTILNNGFVGIGFPQMTDPITLFDVNGDARIRGLRLFLDDPALPGGGEALTRVDTDCLGGALPNSNGLALNFGGGFTDGVFVHGPGLEVCGELEADCLTAEGNVSSRMGNIYALGGAAIPDPCALPNEGKIITMGATGDFIAQGNNGNFIAQGASGDFIAQGADGNFIAEGANGDFIARNGDFVAEAGEVILGDGTVGGRALSRANAGGFGNPEVLTLNTGGDFSGGVRIDGPGLIVGNGAAFTGSPAGHELAVAGSIIAEEVVVKLQANWPDYIFDKSTPRPSIKEWEQFVNENNHLPGMPSAAQVAEKQGVEVGEMQRLLLEKVEQLTLIIIDQQKEIDGLKKALQK